MTGVYGHRCISTSLRNKLTYVLQSMTDSNTPGPQIHTCCCSSIAQSCLTLCDPMDCSTSGFPVHHQLPELAQTHVYRVSDAIQPSHPLSSPSPPASIFPSIRVFSLMSQSFASSHQSIGVSSLASVLPMNTQD